MSEFRLYIKSEDKLSEINHNEEQLNSAKKQNANSDLVNAETERGTIAQEQADQHAKGIEAEKTAAKRSARKELKQALILAAAISAGTELCISLAEEIKLYQQGKQSFGQMAGKVCKRTVKATAMGLAIGGGMAITQYALVRMAASQSVSGIHSGNKMGNLPPIFSVEPGTHDWNTRRSSPWASCTRCWAWVPKLPDRQSIQVKQSTLLFVS